MRRRIIGAGIIPGGMEMMDKPAIHAVEEFVHAGYPLDVEALLIVELDGPQAEVDHLVARVEAIAARMPRGHLQDLDLGGGAAAVLGRPQGRVPGGRPHLARLLLHGRHHPARQAAAGAAAHARAVGAATGCASPTSSMPATATCIRSSSTTPTSAGELERAEAFGADILRLCVEVGGVLTGEHGVGVEKRDLMPVMFNEIDLAQQQRLKCAFDDKGLLNPGKVFPTLHRCAELGRMHVHAGKVAFPDIPRF